MFRSLARQLFSCQNGSLRQRVGMAFPIRAGRVARSPVLTIASIVAAGTVTIAQCEVVDDADIPRTKAHRVQTSDLAEVRQVVRSISARTGGEVDAWVKRASAAFTSCARQDGSLGQDEVCKALQKLSLIQDQGLLWELGPLVFRLLDAERTGSVRLKDFLMGQAILFAVAKNGGGEQLAECCWRALDLNNTGAVTKRELAATVNLMLHLGAVDPDDLRAIKAKAGANTSSGRGRYFTVQENAVVYYMDMYDPQDSGLITREAFAKCSKLQENFRRLLMNDQVMPMFLTHEAQFSSNLKL